MPKLVADLFVSVDGSTSGTTSPGYFGYFGPDLDRWIRDEMSRRRRHLMVSQDVRGARVTTGGAPRRRLGAHDPYADNHLLALSDGHRLAGWGDLRAGCSRDRAPVEAR